MFNKKNIFSILLSSLLIITSLLTVSNYYKIEENKYDIESLKNYINYDQIIYLYSLIDDYDDNYELITINFNDSVDEKQQEEVYQYLKERINEISYISEDENISYWIKRKNGYGTIYSHGNTKNFEENYLLYSHVTIANNNIQCSGDFCEEYKRLTIREFVDNFYLSTSFIGSKEAITIFANEIYLDDITINIPNGYEIYFKINEEIKPNGPVYACLTTFEPFILYFVVAVSLSCLCILLFMLFVPTKLLEEIQPYKTIKHWLLEINILIFGLSIFALGFGLIFILKYTIDGTITYWLNQISLYLYDWFILFINFIIWLIFFGLCSIIPFLLKYMFTMGIFKYFKEHTLIGIGYIKFKSIINDLMNVNVKSSLILQLVSVLLVNGIIVFTLQLLCNNQVSEYVLFMIIIYTLLLFIPSVLFIDKTYKQYQVLLNKTKLLSEGKFDLQIDENVGIFNEYKNELLHVKDGFEKAVQEEIKATNLRSELITNVSHDLKTPITCIKNYVTLLENENDENKRIEYVHNIHSYTNRLASLVEDLFEVSKVSSGNISLELVELDLVDLVKQVFTENEDILLKNELQVISKFDSDHIIVSLDSNKTYRIFENLIVNISKYALPHSRVYVEVKDNNNEAIVEFKNISKDQMTFSPETITERFVRGDSSRHENGSGLGLAIVKSYSELQNIDFKIVIDGDLFKTILTFKK